MARVDVRAAAASGVWRSPQPLPLAHLAVTVNASDSGEVLIFWTQPINTAPPPAAAAPDGSLGITQSATFDTGLAGQGTIYICDLGGRAFDVGLAGSDDPIAASPAAANITRPQSPIAFTTTRDPLLQRGFVSPPLPIPAGTVAVLVLFTTRYPSDNVGVYGAESGATYYCGPVANATLGGAGGTITANVSALLDRHLIIGVKPGQDGDLTDGVMVPLLDPSTPQPAAVMVVNQPLAVPIPNPLPVTPLPDPARLLQYTATLASGGLLTLPTGVPIQPAAIHLRHLAFDVPAASAAEFRLVDKDGAVIWSTSALFAHDGYADFDRYPLPFSPSNPLRIYNSGSVAGTINFSLTYDIS